MQSHDTLSRTVRQHMPNLDRLLRIFPGVEAEVKAIMDAEWEAYIEALTSPGGETVRMEDYSKRAGKRIVDALTTFVQGYGFSIED